MRVSQFTGLTVFGCPLTHSLSLSSTGNMRISKTAATLEHKNFFARLLSNSSESELCFFKHTAFISNYVGMSNNGVQFGHW
jgi:hypothetical protein